MTLTDRRKELDALLDQLRVEGKIDEDVQLGMLGVLTSNEELLAERNALHDWLDRQGVDRESEYSALITIGRVKLAISHAEKRGRGKADQQVGRAVLRMEKALAELGVLPQRRANLPLDLADRVAAAIGLASNAGRYSAESVTTGEIRTILDRYRVPEANMYGMRMPVRQRVAIAAKAYNDQWCGGVTCEPAVDVTARPEEGQADEHPASSIEPTPEPGVNPRPLDVAPPEVPPAAPPEPELVTAKRNIQATYDVLNGLEFVTSAADTTLSLRDRVAVLSGEVNAINRICIEEGDGDQDDAGRVRSLCERVRRVIENLKNALQPAEPAPPEPNCDGVIFTLPVTVERVDGCLVIRSVPKEG